MGNIKQNLRDKMNKQEYINLLKIHHVDKLPQSGLYGELLGIAIRCLNLPESTARMIFGNYTNRQWIALINRLEF